MIRVNYVARLIWMGLLMVLTACGFQPRQATLHDISVHLKFLQADELRKQVSWHLQAESAKIVPATEQADYIMTLSKLAYKKQPVSFSAVTGKAQEYEIHYSVLLKIANAAGDVIVSEQRIVATRDYVFNEDSIVAIAREEIVLQREMLSQLAGAVTRQLMVIAN